MPGLYSMVSGSVQTCCACWGHLPAPNLNLGFYGLFPIQVGHRAASLSSVISLWCVVVAYSLAKLLAS